jgi:16S rRNA processing protein RimM
MSAEMGAKMGAMKDRVCVARVGAAHGTTGEVRLWPFTGRADDVAAYGPLETADGTRRFAIVSLRRGRECLIARLDGVTGRTMAEALCNTDLYVPRERLPEPEADEFYHADLIGLIAEDTAGGTVGTVVAVHNFGAGDIVEIAPAAGGETVMQPFSRAAVPVVDVAGGRIVVAPLEPDPDSGLEDGGERPDGAPQRRSAAGGYCLLRRKTGLPEMHMQIHETRQYCESILPLEH